jgi:ribose transport system permease protein
MTMPATSDTLQHQVQSAPPDSKPAATSQVTAITRKVMHALANKRYSGIWVLLAIITVFACLKPQFFLTRLTFTTILSNEAIIGVLALAALLPLTVGLVDLSIAGVAGFAMVFSSWLSTSVTTDTLLICLIVLAASAAFGFVSGVFVTRLGVNSLVTTLGISTVALGLSELFSGGNTITPAFGDDFFKFGQSYFSVFPLPALYLFLLAVVTYLVIEHTPLGRKCLATGSNPLASRLDGIRTGRLRFSTLVAAAVLSGFAGLVLAAQIGSAADTTGPGLLLPVLATVFLGAAQFAGRPNVGGIVVALLILGTGIKGLELMGAAPWVNDFFYGCMLLVAVAFASRGVGKLS